LSVESTQGQGTTFTLEMLGNRARGQVTNLPQTTICGSNITTSTLLVLCIEDNPSNLRLIEAILDSRREINFAHRNARQHWVWT
jgi:hypothetical protein